MFAVDKIEGPLLRAAIDHKKEPVELSSRGCCLGKDGEKEGGELRAISQRKETIALVAVYTIERARWVAQTREVFRFLPWPVDARGGPERTNCLQHLPIVARRPGHR